MEGHPLRHGWTILRRCLLGLPLVLLVACGGGSPSSPPPKATRIVYTSPTSGAYLLLLNVDQSTDTHLVLNLLGPVGTSGRGVAFHLTAAPGQLSWSKVNSKDAEFAQSAAFGFVLKTKVTSGDLQVGAFLTQTSASSVTFDRTVVLATVALDLVPSATVGTATLRSGNGTAVMLPSSVGADPIAITITVGTVALQ